MSELNFDNLTDSPKGLFAKLKIITQAQSSREAELIQHIKHLNEMFSIVIHRLPEEQQGVLNRAITRGVKLIERL